MYTIGSIKFLQNTVAKTKATPVATTSTTVIVAVNETAAAQTSAVEVSTVEYEITPATVDATTFFETTTVSTEVSVAVMSTASELQPVLDTLSYSTFDGSSGVPFKRDAIAEGISSVSEHEERQTFTGSLLAARVRKSATGVYSTKPHKFYPQEFACEITISVPKVVFITEQKPATTVYITLPAKTSTKTSTSTSTNTIVPAAVTIVTTSTITSTIGITTTPSTTATETKTLTNTVTVASTATVGSVPGSSNYADSRKNYGVFTNLIPPTLKTTTWSGTAAMAYDCCMSCASTDLCAASAFQSGTCTLIMATADSGCLTTTCQGTVSWDSGTSGHIVSNGGCLQWTNYRINS